MKAAFRKVSSVTGIGALTESLAGEQIQPKASTFPQLAAGKDTDLKGRISLPLRNFPFAFLETPLKIFPSFED